MTDLKKTILRVNNVEKTYVENGTNNKTLALRGASFEVNEGEFVAIMGESGSGKSTLLNLVATLDKPTHGEIYLNERKLSDISDKEIARFRREELGFVFQDFNVLNTLSNRDNILLPLVLSGKKINELNEGIERVVKEVGIEEFVDKRPYEISGGQRQRIAIARALINQPSLILADEPTGALDSKTSQSILDLFSRINKSGQTILMVTHSIMAASYADRVLFIRDGIVYSEIYKGESTLNEFRDNISKTISMLNRGNK